MRPPASARLRTGVYVAFSRVRAFDWLTFAASALVIVYVLIVIVSCLAWPVGIYDEAIPLLQARMVAHGLRPHVDFWSYYPPLTYYFDAAAFFVMGETVIAQRALQAIFYVAVLVAVGLFVRARFSVSPAMQACSVLLVAVAIGPSLLVPPWIGFAISLLAYLLYTDAFKGSQVRIGRCAIAGGLAGLAALSRINFGVYVAAVVGLQSVAGLVFDQMRRRQNDGTRRTQHWQAAAVFFACMCFTCISLYAAICGGHLGMAFEQAIAFPKRQASGLRFIPLVLTQMPIYTIIFPSLWFAGRLLVGARSVSARVPLPILSALAVLVLAWELSDNPSLAQNVTLAELACVLLLHAFVFELEQAELGLLLFFVCMEHYYLNRADAAHWMLLVAPAAVLVPYLLFWRVRTEEFGEVTAPPVSFGSAMTLIAFLIGVALCIPGLRPLHIHDGLSLLVSGHVLNRMPDSARMLGSKPPPPAWSAVFPDDAELQALRFVRERTSREDAVFVTTDDESVPFGVDVRAYWLLARPIGTSYYIFDPELTRQAAVQSAMTRSLEDHRVQWAVLEHNPYVDDAFLSRPRSGAKLLDAYMATHFSQVARFGRYSVLRRVTTRN